jgi:hypothetical protein
MDVLPVPPTNQPAMSTRAIALKRPTLDNRMHASSDTLVRW